MKALFGANAVPLTCTAQDACGGGNQRAVNGHYANNKITVDNLSTVQVAG